MPLFCGATRDQEDAVRAAVAFGAPTIWLHDSWPPGRSLTAAMECGVPAIYAECGGGGGVRLADLDAYVSGVLSVMAELGMLSESSRTRSSPRWVSGSGDLDAGVRSSYAGLFVVSATAGEVVPEDGEVGRLYGYRGELLEVMRAARSGVVMFLRRQAQVRPGDVLFVVATRCVGP
jgi:predicted deacylase